MAFTDDDGHTCTSQADENGTFHCVVTDYNLPKWQVYLVAAIPYEPEWGPWGWGALGITGVIVCVTVHCWQPLLNQNTNTGNTPPASNSSAEDSSKTTSGTTQQDNQNEKKKDEKEKEKTSDNKFDSKDPTQRKMKAGDIISKFKKGSVRSKFPSNMESQSFEDIDKAAKGGDPDALSARKLLTDSRFNK
jgi:hypothetical protein